MFTLNRQHLISISPESIQEGNIHFNLYVSDADRILLFCRSGFNVTRKQIEYLRVTGKPLFICSSELAKFTEYFFNAFDSFLALKGYSAASKAECLYENCCYAGAQVFDPGKENISLEKAVGTVDAVLEYLYREPGNSRYLLNFAKANPHPANHGINSMIYSLFMGLALLPARRKDLLKLGVAALLHDIGKSRIHQAILRKRDTLTESEMKTIRRHPVWSQEIIVNNNMADDIAAAVRGHHERWDGKGYPDGLSKYDIPLFARIIAIADSYDFITSEKAFNGKKANAEAMETMLKEIGKFDPELIQVFRNILVNGPDTLAKLIGQSNKATGLLFSSCQQPA